VRELIVPNHVYLRIISDIFNASVVKHSWCVLIAKLGGGFYENPGKPTAIVFLCTFEWNQKSFAIQKGFCLGNLSETIFNGKIVSHLLYENDNQFAIVSGLQINCLM